jgi:hypothetical protein
VADLKYRYGKVGPDNRLVAAELEKDLERAIEDLMQMEARVREEKPGC